MPGDLALERWSRASRYAGSKDRAAVRDMVWSALRHPRQSLFAVGAAAPTGRALLLGHLKLSGIQLGDLQTQFGAGPYAPAALTDEEQAGFAAGFIKPDAATAHDLAPGIYQALERSLGAMFEAELTAARARGPLDLRVNHRRIARDRALTLLGDLGLEAAATPLAPHGIRLAGWPRLETNSLYLDGLIEPQDEASQLAIAWADVPAGGAILDYCAGAGGKTLALAAGAGPDARIVAHDSDLKRLSRLAPRAERAGIAVEFAGPRDLSSGAGDFDLVFVDAPCTGTGTFRRAPDLRLRLEMEGLERSLALQDQVLAAAAPHVRLGGHLLYATCSLIDQENQGAITRFLAGRSDFKLVSLLGPHADAQQGMITLLTHREGTDGFFMARLERVA